MVRILRHTTMPLTQSKCRRLVFPRSSKTSVNCPNTVTSRWRLYTPRQLSACQEPSGPTQTLNSCQVRRACITAQVVHMKSLSLLRDHPSRSLEARNPVLSPLWASAAVSLVLARKELESGLLPSMGTAWKAFKRKLRLKNKESSI